MSSLFGAKYLAVLDLEPEGLSASEAKILTQRLTSKIIDLGNYTVVERANIDKILAEMKFQTTSGCVDSECAVEIGQMAGAEVTVIGTVSKFGDTYTIDARIIDVESGSALASASFTHTGKIDELVKDGIESIAHKLLGIPYKKKISSGTASKASSGYGATLEINSDPPGAAVYIGGNYFDTTPLILEDFPPGNYEVELKLEKYKSLTQSVRLLPKGTQKIYPALISLPPTPNVNNNIGYLIANIYPVTATIYIDKHPIYNSPISSSESLNDGTWQSSIEVLGTPRPREVMITINGKQPKIEYFEAGNMDYYSGEISVFPGVHNIRISKKYFYDYLISVSVDLYETETIHYELIEKNSDTRWQGTEKPFSFYTQLLSGEHMLRVSQSGYDDYIGEFEIKLDEITELTIELNRE